MGIFYGHSLLLSNYIFLVMLGLSIGIRSERIQLKQFTSTLSLAVIPIFAYIFINLLLNYSSVIEAQAMSVYSGSRPSISRMVFSGGLNLESTYLAMFLVFFIKSKWFFPLYCISLFIAVAYMSRTGFLLNILVLLFWVYLFLRSKISRHWLYLCLPFAVLAVLCLVVSVSYLSEMHVVKRFMEIGNEPGSRGRIEILEYIKLGVLDSGFMGYGPGNTMDRLSLLGMDSHNSNVHNYYFQLMLDFGIFGLLAYVVFVGFFLTRADIQIEFKLFLTLYLIGSFVQFQGAEQVVWLFLYLAFFVVADDEYIGRTGVIKAGELG